VTIGNNYRVLGMMSSSFLTSLGLGGNAGIEVNIRIADAPIAFTRRRSRIASRQQLKRVRRHATGAVEDAVARLVAFIRIGSNRYQIQLYGDVEGFCSTDQSSESFPPRLQTRAAEGTTYRSPWLRVASNCSRTDLRYGASRTSR